jgi:hypothetical protein
VGSFIRGDRVVRKTNRDTVGTVVGLSADPPTVHVLWDGETAADTVNPLILENVEG